MKTVIIMEDKGKSLSGGILSSTGSFPQTSEALMHSYNGNNIWFSCSSVFMLKEILAHVELGERVVALYDVSPDNKSTINGFSYVLKQLKDRGLLKNYSVLLIPFPCIELSVLSVLNTVGSDNISSERGIVRAVECLVNEDWEYVSKLYGRNKSLEVFCKYLLNHVLSCFRNKSNKGNQFFRLECNGCSTCDCKETIKRKRELLYLSLACYFVNEDYLGYLSSIGLSTNRDNNVSERDVILYYIDYYDRLFAAYGCINGLRQEILDCYGIS